MTHTDNNRDRRLHLFFTVAFAGLFIATFFTRALAADWRSGYEKNTQCKAAVALGDNGPAASDGNAHCVEIEAADPTYFATGSGYTAYATPTDTICIFGSASKVIYVTGFYISPNSTTATVQIYSFVKRSTADSGGTATNPTPLAYDSANPAPTAVVSLYTAAPGLGTLLGTLRAYVSTTAVLTAAGGAIGMDNVGTSYWAQPASMVSQRQPVALRGTNEGLCLNFAGAALPGGWTTWWGVEWIEKSF